LTRSIVLATDKHTTAKFPLWVQQGASAFPESRGKVIQGAVLKSKHVKKSRFKVLRPLRMGPDSLYMAAEKQIYDKVLTFTSNMINRYTDAVFSQTLNSKEKADLIKEASRIVVDHFKEAKDIAFIGHYDEKNRMIYLLATYNVSRKDYLLMMMVNIGIRETLAPAEEKYGLKYSRQVSSEKYMKILKNEALKIGLSAYVKYLE